MSRLIHSQALNVRPLQNGFSLPRHLRRPKHGRELNECGLPGRLRTFDDLAQRHADPGNHHRPRLDASKTVDALLQLNRLHEIVDVVVRRFVAETIDLDRPRTGLQVSAVALRVVFLDPKFVKIVVAGDLVNRVQLLIDGDFFLLVSGQGEIRSAK